MANYYYRRRFLNRRGYNAGAYIIAEVKSSTWGKKKEHKEIVGDLTIADCSRVVTLDFGGFSVKNKKDLDHALYKAHNLREVINGFVEALEKAVEDLED